MMTFVSSGAKTMSQKDSPAGVTSTQSQTISSPTYQAVVISENSLSSSEIVARNAST